ncbi:DNA gyrase inhibitor YacG [Aureimonas pseudogalii]|uniref:DNA gyrase inhibitor YacG n=1 Tax=Aureimonas pseudogalii TaxID=1744844 RepID=UPI001606E3ED|nr:DNA gyrase inhibitor YacG [Aureimonas pseudogalii]
MSASVVPLRPRRRCPECGRVSDRESFPFCSPRCKAVDLNRWLKGSYVLPGPETDRPPSEPDDES